VPPAAADGAKSVGGGREAGWWPVLLVQPFGPPAYLLWGRRRG
jgi:hypothetical protein